MRLSFNTTMILKRVSRSVAQQEHSPTSGVDLARVDLSRVIWVSLIGTFGVGLICRMLLTRFVGCCWLDSYNADDLIRRMLLTWWRHWVQYTTLRRVQNLSSLSVAFRQITFALVGALVLTQSRNLPTEFFSFHIPPDDVVLARCGLLYRV